MVPILRVKECATLSVPQSVKSMGLRFDLAQPLTGWVIHVPLCPDFLVW